MNETVSTSSQGMEKVFEIFDGKTVLVTGGTGTFGCGIVDLILRTSQCKKLIVLSRDEYKQYVLAQDFSPEKYPSIRYFIGDVRNLGRMEMAMQDVDYVVHAAAMKQVTTAEYNPLECVHTNILGAENIVRAAIRCGVRKVIAISTDKAVAPVNLYGATKLASDKIFTAANHLSGKDGTIFSVVRYGNVLESHGSVVPFFHRLKEEGADRIPITDVRMTRFAITLNHGIRFVVQSLSDMRGGEVFVPKLPSFRIVDLAEAICPGLPHEIVGIRPGEKVHELLVSDSDARHTLELDDSFIIDTPFVWDDRLPLDKTLGSSVAEDLEYRSDTNADFLSIDQIRDLTMSSGM